MSAKLAPQVDNAVLYLDDPYLAFGTQHFNDGDGLRGSISSLGSSPRAQVSFISAEGMLVDRLVEATLEEGIGEILIMGTSTFLMNEIQTPREEASVVWRVTLPD